MSHTPVNNGEPELNWPDDGQVRISFVVEWANTTYNGIPRFQGMLEILIHQWRQLDARDYPESLAPDEVKFLNRVQAMPELLLVAGEAIETDLEAEFRKRCAGVLELRIHVAEGLEYYALKNFGAGKASGDILIFLDCDVYPDAGWLCHLLGSFGREGVGAVAGQPYVAPIDLMSRAFALGWTYELADHSGRMFHSEKFYANNFALWTELFRRAPFQKLTKRTRGAAMEMGARLKGLGYPVWQNCSARVDHPAPSSTRHMLVRALAHGRDYYMRDSETRSFRGLKRSQLTAARRLNRGLSRTFRDYQQVGLSMIEIPFVLAIIGMYYAFFSLGGVLTHISPDRIGSRFRV